MGAHHDAGRLDVALLGPLAVRVDGHDVRVPSRQQRAVLARLVLAADRVVTRAELADTLWPDAAPANASGNLLTCVSRLRALVGTARITALDAYERLVRYWRRTGNWTRCGGAR